MDVSLAAAIASARFSRSVFLQPKELIVLNTRFYIIWCNCMLFLSK